MTKRVTKLYLSTQVAQLNRVLANRNLYVELSGDPDREWHQGKMILTLWRQDVDTGEDHVVLVLADELRYKGMAAVLRALLLIEEVPAPSLDDSKCPSCTSD